MTVFGLKHGRRVVLLLMLQPGFWVASRDRQEQPAQATVHAGQQGCTVELDAVPAGRTNAQGDFALQNVDPTDHYVHVDCPGQQERIFFVSARPGEDIQIQARLGAPPSPAADPLRAAEARIELRQLVRQAVQLRARGLFDEAVQDLREAVKLDPENSDLHRELGITFLLIKDWKRARVEMLETTKHDPSDADAHNGLGYALEKLGSTAAALEEYRTATHLEPDNDSYRRHYLDALAQLAAEQADKKK